MTAVGTEIKSKEKRDHLLFSFIPSVFACRGTALELVGFPTLPRQNHRIVSNESWPSNTSWLDRRAKPNCIHFHRQQGCHWLLDIFPATRDKIHPNFRSAVHHAHRIGAAFAIIQYCRYNRITLIFVYLHLPLILNIETYLCYKISGKTLQLCER